MTPDDTNSYPEIVYTIRVKKPSGRSWYRTRWKMTTADAAKQFEGKEWELVESSREERRVWKDGYAPAHNHNPNIPFR